MVSNLRLRIVLFVVVEKLIPTARVKTRRPNVALNIKTCENAQHLKCNISDHLNLETGLNLFQDQSIYTQCSSRVSRQRAATLKYLL